MQCVKPLIPLYDAPYGARQRQLIYGANVTVLGQDGAFSWIKQDRDGYSGYVLSTALGPRVTATHWVNIGIAHCYRHPSIKAEVTQSLPFLSECNVQSEQDGFAKTELGWIHLAHLRFKDQKTLDPVAVAETFAGSSYLWGGNSIDGVDCSGLVQLSCWACGIPCPADSHDQAAFFRPLDMQAPFQRGQLIFWTGHVAWISDPETLLHATAATMSVVYEPIEKALDRIAAQGEGRPILRTSLNPKEVRYD